MSQTTLRKPLREANFINLTKGIDKKKKPMANLILKESERLLSLQDQEQDKNIHSHHS